MKRLRMTVGIANAIGMLVNLGLCVKWLMIGRADLMAVNATVFGFMVGCSLTRWMLEDRA